MKRIISIVVFGIVVAVQTFAQTDLQPAAIVRLTRSEPITVKQLRTEVERFERQGGRPLTSAERRQVLDVMINERLAIQAAERDRITISDNELNQQIQQLRAMMAQQIGRQPTDAEFTTAIREETGLDMPAFREQVRRQAVTQKYLMTKKEALFRTVTPPTEAEIREAYMLARSQFVRPESVRFSMIQVPYGPDAASRTRAKGIADQLIREIGSDPARFDEAVLRGQSPAAGFQAGDGGYLPRNTQAQQIVGQEFMNAAFSLRQGQVSRLIEGVGGFQIIKITETHVQRNLELDDIFQLGSRATVRDYIGNVMFQERQQRILEQATQELITELRRGNPFQIFENNLNW